MLSTLLKIQQKFARNLKYFQQQISDKIRATGLTFAYAHIDSPKYEKGIRKTGTPYDVVSIADGVFMPFAYAQYSQGTPFRASGDSREFSPVLLNYRMCVSVCREIIALRNSNKKHILIK